MLKESLPPLRNKQTSARYSLGAGGLAAAMSPASRRLSKVFKTEIPLTAAQLACPIKRRREISLGFGFVITKFYRCTLNSGEVTMRSMASARRSLCHCHEPGPMRSIDSRILWN